MPTPKPYVAKDGSTTWRVRYRDTLGRSRSTTFTTRRDATWFANQITERGVGFALRSLRDLLNDTGEHESPPLAHVFAEFIAWKADYVRSARTIEDYKRQYADSIDKALGPKPIAAITPDDVSDWVDRMVAGKISSPRTGKRLSPKTISGRHALLHSIMEYAADPRRAYVTANPCAGVTLPQRLRPAPKGLLPGEWQAIRAALANDCPDATALADFLLNTGFRWSEGAALTPAGVEDYGPHSPMYINMIQVLRRGKGGAVVAVPDGKAEKSMRRIKLDPDTAATVRSRLVGRGTSEPVFGAPDGGFWTYNKFRVRWRRAVLTAGITRAPTIHWLRHTHVAWLAMSGAPLPQLQARIGHASIQTTIGVYGRMISDVGDDALEAFTRMRDSSLTLAAPVLPDQIEPPHPKVGHSKIE